MNVNKPLLSFSRSQQQLLASHLLDSALNLLDISKRQKTAALDSSQTAAAFLDSCLNGDNQTHEYI